jgi:hypothetical protein
MPTGGRFAGWRRLGGGFGGRKSDFPLFQLQFLAFMSAIDAPGGTDAQIARFLHPQRFSPPFGRAIEPARVFIDEI